MEKKKWYKLDTAALIFPAIKQHNWNNIFRVSVSLKEDVDPSVLQTAVINLMPRFPSFYVRLRRGLFWNYLEGIEEPPVVRRDYEEASMCVRLPVSICA